MAYGKIKADTLVYDNNGSDVEKTVASLAAAAPTADPTFTGTATFNNLTVNGTTTTINSTTLTVDDKNIVLGSVDTPTDTTADGGGITLKGATDKTITWLDSTDSWTFNQTVTTPELLVNGTNGTSYNVEIQPGQTATPYGLRVKEPASAGTGYPLFNVTDNSGNAYLRVDSVTGKVSDSKGDLRAIPKNAQSSAYTLVASDAGKVIVTNSNVTLNTTMGEGDVITILNESTSDITITQGSGVTIYNSADGSTGNRTLAARGMATMYSPYSNGTNAYISGTGLS